MARRISSPRFVGRGDELEALERLLAETAAGSGGAVLVTGDAGIGKSRLVSELAARARAADALVLVGECVELAGGELAFAPVISALREVMSDVAVVEELPAPLRGALAALWPLPGVAVAGGGREQLFEATYRVLARLAAERPVLLIMEDVHWIDPSSRDLVAFLVRNARRDRIAVVATYRPDELDRGHPLRPFLAELERSGRAERIDLEALRRAEVAEQLEAIAGAAPGAAVVERIFHRSEGNPFFAEELLASAEPGDGELPGSLRETLLLRIERLSELTRDVLRAAAVAGRSVDHRLLVSVVAVPDAELLRALREATDQHVLVQSTATAAYVFRHALLREAIYGDTIAGERLRLHRAIAETLAAHREYAGTAPAAELAHHWYDAGEETAALAASLEAADEAEGMHAFGEALGHTQRALRLWERVAEPETATGRDEIDLLLNASRLADWTGDATQALALAERARAGLDDRVEPLRAALAETRIGRAMHFAGRGADAVEHLARARRLVPREPPSLAYAEALAAEARALMLVGRMTDARERLEEVLPLAERLGARVVQASALNTLAIVCIVGGERERAIDAGREGLRIAEQICSVDEIMRAYINGSQAIEDAGSIEEALELGIEGIAAADRLGMARGAGDQLRVQAAWRLQRLGRLAEAERIARQLVDEATTPFNTSAAGWLTGRLAVERGDLALAASELDRAWPLVQRSGGFQLIGPTSAALVLLEIRRGELEHARECARDGLDRAAAAEGDLIYGGELYWLAVHVEAELGEQARAAGDREAVRRCEEAAAAALDAFEAAVGRVPGDGAPPETLAFATLARAELTRLRGERSAEPWLAAAQRFRALGAVYPAAQADLRAAEALALAGARPAAVAEPLRAAHAVALAVGARPFLDDVLTLARRAGVSLGDAEDDGAGAAVGLGLTDRELEVLRLVADGCTNRQIGEELFITPKTASVHVSRILVKLGVANRAEAAATAHRTGLART